MIHLIWIIPQTSLFYVQYLCPNTWHYSQFEDMLYDWLLELELYIIFNTSAESAMPLRLKLLGSARCVSVRRNAKFIRGLSIKDQERDRR